MAKGTGYTDKIQHAWSGFSSNNTTNRAASAVAFASFDLHKATSSRQTAHRSKRQRHQPFCQRRSFASAADARHKDLHPGTNTLSKSLVSNHGHKRQWTGGNATGGTKAGETAFRKRSQGRQTAFGR